MEDKRYKEIKKQLIDGFNDVSDISLEDFDKLQNTFFSEYNRRANLVLESEEYQSKYGIDDEEYCCEKLDDIFLTAFVLIYPELDNLRIIIDLEDISTQIIYSILAKRFNTRYPISLFEDNTELKQIIMNEKMVDLIKKVYFNRAKEIYEEFGAMTEKQKEDIDEYIENYIILDDSGIYNYLYHNREEYEKWIEEYEKENE